VKFRFHEKPARKSEDIVRDKKRVLREAGGEKKRTLEWGKRKWSWPRDGGTTVCLNAPHEKKEEKKKKEKRKKTGSLRSTKRVVHRRWWEQRGGPHLDLPHLKKKS